MSESIEEPGQWPRNFDSLKRHFFDDRLTAKANKIILEVDPTVMRLYLCSYAIIGHWQQLSCHAKTST